MILTAIEKKIRVFVSNMIKAVKDLYKPVKILTTRAGEWEYVWLGMWQE